MKAVTADIINASDLIQIEAERKEFELDAAAYGFDLRRDKCSCPNPACEYADEATGQRWAGWLARSGYQKGSQP